MQPQYTPAHPENFAAWFGASVTLGPNGLPLVFYHKSRSKEVFSEFKHTGVQKNPYNAHYGFYFVIPHHKHYVEYLGQGIEVYAWLKMQKPFTITQYTNTHIEDCEGGQYSSINLDEPFCRGLIDKGYDSVIIKGIGFYNQYVCFYPQQIKSVNNTGAFGLDNNDIFN